jgi:hypothetical protein
MNLQEFVVSRRKAASYVQRSSWQLTVSQQWTVTMKGHVTNYNEKNFSYVTVS